MSDDGPAATDAPFRGTADPLGPRLQQFTLAPPGRRLPARPPYIVGAVAVSAVCAVTGNMLAALGFANGAFAGLVGWHAQRRARRRAVTICVHERGLRVDVDLPWDAIDKVTVDTTPDQGDAPTTLSIATGDARATVVGTAKSIGPLVAAIEVAIGPRHHREAAARFDAGQDYAFGQQAFTRDGLRAGDALVAWPDLGPIRRHGGKLVCATPIGTFTTPIVHAPNPWMIERLVAERGRTA